MPTSDKTTKQAYGDWLGRIIARDPYYMVPDAEVPPKELMRRLTARISIRSKRNEAPNAQP